MRHRRRGRRGLSMVAVAMLLAGVAGWTPFASTAASAATPGTITLDGTPVTVRVDQAGQATRLAFQGTSGQRVSVVVSHSTVGPDCPALVVSLQRPNGSQLGATDVCGTNGFVDTHTLG